MSCLTSSLPYPRVYPEADTKLLCQEGLGSLTVSYPTSVDFWVTWPSHVMKQNNLGQCLSWIVYSIDSNVFYYYFAPVNMFLRSIAQCLKCGRHAYGENIQGWAKSHQKEWQGIIPRAQSGKIILLLTQPGKPRKILLGNEVKLSLA